ncbi:helix-turn-helix domain-containing protein [Algoriphagus formosus]|uniref:XRE family transcriptional regulator n=1 Tax=Algoriphagus formosus TaxID=2007308 RepID=A0A4R5UWC2_9BACT|nr:helix-turn-helix transcriptional regulator [Algoriphagus aquimaris]TDK43584.1 XRE family transcriptional regulator [Algoriphagus aquimaris]
MKQPELGKKISEWRKAKGLTQEELVEKCNLNVRTIQRIEAGEVTPRSYTIKTILEALGMEIDPEPVVSFENTDGNIPWMIYAAVAGFFVYFFASIFEIFSEFELVMEGKNIATMSLFLIKIFSYGGYILFMVGWIKMLDFFPNKLLKIALSIMIGANFVFLGMDALALLTNSIDLIDYYPVKVSTFGLMYAILGMGFIAYQKAWSNMALVIGVLTVIAGVLVFSGIGALLGLIPLTLAELAQVGLMIYLITKIGGKSSPDSTSLVSEF